MRGEAGGEGIDRCDAAQLLCSTHDAGAVSCGSCAVMRHLHAEFRAIITATAQCSPLSPSRAKEGDERTRARRSRFILVAPSLLAPLHGAPPLSDSSSIDPWPPCTPRDTRLHCASLSSTQPRAAIRSEPSR